MSREPPNRKFYRNERMSATDLCYYLQTEAQHLALVLDHEYPVVKKRPFLWVVTRRALADKPARFTPLETPAQVEAELRTRALFASLSPGGWIQLRKLPEDSA